MSHRIRKAIQRSGLTIYDSLDDRPKLFLGNEGLERLLHAALRGLNLDYKLRTRSKVAKAAVCTALGYPIPATFRRSKPRFPGQNFDTYVQKSDNLQIWNEDISASRRYVLIHLDSNNVVSHVRVVSGELLSLLDTTGTLTQKYQARHRAPVLESCLVSPRDTHRVVTRLIESSLPNFMDFLPIGKVYKRLLTLLGRRVPNIALDQERNRGGALHLLVRDTLGCHGALDTGQFPDILRSLVRITCLIFRLLF